MCLARLPAWDRGEGAAGRRRNGRQGEARAVPQQGQPAIPVGAGRRVAPAGPEIQGHAHAHDRVVSGAARLPRGVAKGACAAGNGECRHDHVQDVRAGAAGGHRRLHPVGRPAAADGDGLDLSVGPTLGVQAVLGWELARVAARALRAEHRHCGVAGVEGKGHAEAGGQPRVREHITRQPRVPARLRGRALVLVALLGVGDVRVQCTAQHRGAVHREGEHLGGAAREGQLQVHLCKRLPRQERDRDRVRRRPVRAGARGARRRPGRAEARGGAAVPGGGGGARVAGERARGRPQEVFQVALRPRQPAHAADVPLVLVGDETHAPLALELVAEGLAHGPAAAPCAVAAQGRHGARVCGAVHGHVRVQPLQVAGQGGGVAAGIAARRGRGCRGAAVDEQVVVHTQPHEARVCGDGEARPLPPTELPLHHRAAPRGEEREHVRQRRHRRVVQRPAGEGRVAEHLDPELGARGDREGEQEGVAARPPSSLQQMHGGVCQDGQTCQSHYLYPDLKTTVGSGMCRLQGPRAGAAAAPCQSGAPAAKRCPCPVRHQNAFMPSG